MGEEEADRDDGEAANAEQRGDVVDWVGKTESILRFHTRLHWQR